MTTNIICQEQGTPNADRWSQPFSVSPEDEGFLEERVAQDQLEVARLSTGQLRIAGRKYCGRLRLPTGRWLQIQSKIPPSSILEWMVYSRSIPALQSWVQDAVLDPGADVATALASLFLRELTTLTQFHLRPGYAILSRVQQVFRGRLLERRLACEVGQLPSLPCAYRNRTMDTVPNRVLARALDASWRLGIHSTLDEAGRRRLERLTMCWAGIDRSLPSLRQALVEATACPPLGYHNALQLARLLLDGAGFDLVGGDGGDSFLVSMAGIWERALRRMTAGWARRNGWAPVPASARTRFWDDGSEKRSFVADVMVQHPSGERVVLDAKYKCGYGHESREDCFQMATYVLAFHARTAILVYPTGEGRPRTLLQSDLVPGGATVMALELPMASGPCACEKQLAVKLPGQESGGPA